MIGRVLDRIEGSADPVHFVGSQKNSGKTTTLLRVYQGLLDRKIPTLLCSTGIDGEVGDHFFGHEKPQVRVEPGTFVLTREAALQDTRACLLAMFPQAGDGRFGLFEILSPGAVELWGPPSAGVLHDMLNMARGIIEHRMTGSREMKQAAILVDGSLDRQAIAARGESLMILCMAAGAFSGMQAACNWLRFAAARYTLPLWEPGDYPDVVQIDGPLTNQVARDIPEAPSGGVQGAQPGVIVVSSPMHLFLDEGLFFRLLPRLRVLRKPEWIGLSVYPGGKGVVVDGKRFQKEAQLLVGDLPVFDPLALPTMREG